MNISVHSCSPWIPVKSLPVNSQVNPYAFIILTPSQLKHRIQLLHTNFRLISPIVPPIGTVSEQDKPHNICSVLLIVAMARSWETVAREEEEKKATSDRKKQNKGRIYIL